MKKRWFRCSNCCAPRLVAVRWWRRHLPDAACQRAGCGHTGLRRAVPAMILPGREVRSPVGWNEDLQRAAVESLRQARQKLNQQNHQQHS